MLISGEAVKYNPSDARGFLIKCTDNGTVLWAKRYDSSNHKGFDYINYYRVAELHDGSLLMVGSTNNIPNDNDDIIITKTDNSGDIIWNKIFKSRLWTRGRGSADFYNGKEIKEDPYTGDIFLTGQHWTQGRSIIKLDPSNGTILWSKLYQQPFGGFFDNPFGLDIRSNEIRCFGSFVTNYNTYTSVYRINKLTGDTIQSKFFTINDPAGYNVSFVLSAPLTILNNGNYALSGMLSGYDQSLNNYTIPGYHTGVVEIDTNLNFVKAYALRNSIISNGYNTKISVFPDGSGLFSMLHFTSPGGYSPDVYYIQFKNGVILKQRKKSYIGQSPPWENQSVKLPDGGDLIIKLLGDSATNIPKIEFLKLHVSDTSSACLGIDDFSTFIQPYNCSSVYGLIDSVGSNVFQENPNKTLIAENVSLNYIPGCQQVSVCDSLKLTPSANTLCTAIPLIIKVNKNPGCGTPVVFSYDSSHLQSFTRLSDSTYRVIFNSSWQGFIYASLSGCNYNLDSIKVNVLQPPSVLNLGPDTVLCPGNTILLNAKKGFSSYQWQDGSTDSTFAVTQPGTYFVKTTDACGGLFYDTVIVSAHPPIPFNIGPDLSKCNQDSLSLTAPAGFISYVWSPSYNISSVSSQTVFVFPSTDTMYSVKAEKTPGCFAYDTVKIKVFSSPVIDLGVDRSLCSGDSIILNAGNGFSSYSWNTGASYQQIVVKAAGPYSVIATTTDNCSSRDTFLITAVNPNPVVNLDHDSTLCAGTSRILNAGNFVSFLWNTGNTSQLLSVNNPGFYFVTVTDKNNCKGSDSVRITTIFTSPVDFLPDDTSVCSYGSILISSEKTFTNYLWNTNAITSQ